MILRNFNKIITRNINYKARTDPGIQRRSRILKPTEDDIEEDNFDIENVESDFMSANLSHREHLEEIKKFKEKEKLSIVRRKYFKEKFPNFLTWNDKQQIKYLYGKDPERWSIEVLSEGFPALPGVIKKIIKAKYDKNDLKQIENHDRTVEKNWNEFKKGNLKDLPFDLKEHLSKFTDRKLNFTQYIKEKKVTKTNTGGEFSEIISSYEKIKNKNKEIENENVVESHNKLRFDNIKFKDKTNVTLKELKHKIENDILKSKKISEDEKLIVKSQSNKIEIQNTENINNKNEIDIKKITKSEIVTLKQSPSKYSHLIYPEKIKIPEELHQEGTTYKVNDCYYHSDGSFLYRVPGYYK